MGRFQPGVSGNPKGRTKGVTHPSTFFKKELFQKNKERIRNIFLLALDKAEIDQEKWAIELIFKHTIPILSDLGEDEVHNMVEEKLKTISRDHLEKIQREIFDAMKMEPVTIENVERENNDQI